MTLLDGDLIQLDTPSLKKAIGMRVEYLLEWDVDKSGRGYIFPKFGTINDVHGRQIQIDDDWFPISKFREIAKR